MNPKRILLITSWYNRAEDNPNLINDLSAQLSRDGHHVTVVAVDWYGGASGVAHYRESEGTEVLFVTPPPAARRTMLRRAFRFVAISFATPRKIKPMLAGRQFDLIVAIAPLSNQIATVRWAQRRFRCRSYLYVTDFFPHHHRQIRSMPGGVAFRAALAIETALMRRFDVIGCMSPANLIYLRSHYALRDGQRSEVLGLWGPIDRPAAADRSSVRTLHGLPLDRSIAIYGGQLSAGRGFDEVLEAARLARHARPDLFFLIIGQGPLEKEIAAAADEGGNIVVKPRVPREQYLTLLAACDVGLVCTVPGVDVPTFPSKTIDLLRAGLPIAASVENTTDYAEFIRSNGIGIAVEAGSGQRFLDAICTIVDHPEQAEETITAGRDTLLRCFDVRKITARLLAQSFPEDVISAA